MLADARAAGAERFVLGGDYAAFGAFPSETLARLRELAAVWIRGNTERWLAAPDEAPEDLLSSLRFCAGEVGPTLVEELAALPQSTAVEGVRVCHASPRSDMETFMPEPSADDDRLVEERDEDVIVFGHSHLQFRRTSGSHALVNPGSVGMPLDGDRRAAYALWSGGDAFELRRVEYDWAAYATELRERLGVTLGDAVETLVHRIEQASFS